MSALSGLPSLVRSAFGVEYAPMEQAFTVELNGETISHVGVSRRRVLIDDKPLIVAAIGWVVTAEPYRNGGLATALMRTAHVWAVKNGYEYAALFTGIPAFYTPKGYMPMANPPGRGFMIKSFRVQAIDRHATVDVQGPEW